MFSPTQSMPQADVPVLIYLSTNNVVAARYSQPARAMAELYLSSRRAPSRGAVTNPPANDQERQRRAVFLLWEAMEWANPLAFSPFPNLNAVPVMNVAELFEFTIYKALMVYDAKNNSTFAAKHVLETVFAGDPIRFLTHNHVMIMGSAQRVNGTGDQNVIPFYFSFDVADKFLIDLTPGPGKYQFNAASIIATHWTAVPGRGNDANAGSFAGIQAIEVAGAQIVVTTQFTGCSLCFRHSGANLYAAHINPGGTSVPPAIDPLNGGNVVARQLCGLVNNVAGADFANAHGAVSVYGRQQSNLNAFPNGYGGPNLAWFTMIGFNQGGWHLYTQDNNIGGGNGMNGPIANVRQIYP